MALVDVRALAVKATKRWDLVVAGDLTADNGMDSYINAGSRFLDNMTDFRSGMRRQFALLNAGDFTVEVGDLISPENVVISDLGDNDRVDITSAFLEYDQFRIKYPDHWADMDSGKPSAWSIAFSELAPDQHTETAATFTSAGFEDFGDMVFESDTDTKTVLVFALPADQTYQVEIIGKFYAKTLVANTDYNYWTINEPHLLAKAAAQMVELEIRDSSAIATAQAALAPELNALDAASIHLEHAGKGNVRNG